MRLLSNFRGFGALLTNAPGVEFQDIDDVSTARLVWLALTRADCIILNIGGRRLLVLCAILAMVAPRGHRRCQIVSVDILLRPPGNRRSRLIAAVKSALLRQVDIFVLYFKDWEGYIRQYRIPRERIRYVPFKANSWEYLSRRRLEIGEGDHVLCIGATLRDWDTFVEAARRSGVPAVLVLPGDMREVGQKAAWYRDPPPNLRIEFHEDGQERTYLGYMESARIVCIPRFRRDIASTGISAYLCAMALGRCVVISSGPGAEDVLAEHEAAAFFEPENPQALAETLTALWTDDALRRRFAANGQRYADRLEGEPRMLRDILRVLDLPGA